MASKQTNTTVRTRENHPFHCSFLNGSVRVPSRMRTMPHTVNPAIKPLFSLAMAPMFGKREDWAGDFDASRALTTAGGLNPEGEDGASRRSVGYGGDEIQYTSRRRRRRD